MKKEKVRVSPEVFKQLIFDNVMEAQNEIPESAANAILDTLNRYEIGPIWRKKSYSEEIPSDGAKYYCIRTIQGIEYSFCLRVSGGFRLLRSPEKMISDKEVAAFCALVLPPKLKGEDMAILSRTRAKEISWSEIAVAIKEGRAAKLLCVGDTIFITLKNGQPMRIAVAGIDIYVKNEVIFAFQDILPEQSCINADSTYTNIYDGSDMAKYLDSEIFALLPDDLQAVIKERRDHKLWLFSACEIYGKERNHNLYSTDGDLQMPYYKNKENRKKRRNGKIDAWWTSSSCVIGSDFVIFDQVKPDGDSCPIPDCDLGGVAPGFSIR